MTRPCPSPRAIAIKLVQVFLNLAKNAAEAIEEGASQGEIVFQTAFRPGIRMGVPGSPERISLPLEVCVHDTGAGIHDDILPHLFDPFVTSKSNGKGLGLALVAKIIRDHGGMIDCRSGAAGRPSASFFRWPDARPSRDARDHSHRR